MTNHPRTLTGAILLDILSYVTAFGTQEPQAMFLLWRQLSNANRKLVDGAAKRSSFADRVFLSFEYPMRALKKLAFFIENLNVDVKKLTIVTDLYFCFTKRML